MSDPTPTYAREDRNAARSAEWPTEAYTTKGQNTMTTLDELRETLIQITSELAGLNIATDGEVARRIGALVVEGRELIRQLEAEGEVSECKCHGAER